MKKLFDYFNRLRWAHAYFGAREGQVSPFEALYVMDLIDVETYRRFEGR